MTQSGVKNRRRDVLSLPGAQLRIILVFAVLALVYAMVNVYVSKRAFDKVSRVALAAPMGPVEQRDLALTIQDQEETLDIQLSMFTFLSFCMLCLAGVLISHRLGGPVFHLKKYMHGTIDGTVPPRAVHFRKDDFFHDLAESFNRFQEHHGILKPGGDKTTPGDKT